MVQFLYYPHLLDKKTEAQRGEVTSPVTCYQVARLGLELGSYVLAMQFSLKHVRLLLREIPRYKTRKQLGHLKGRRKK